MRLDHESISSLGLGTRPVFLLLLLVHRPPPTSSFDGLQYVKQMMAPYPGPIYTSTTHVSQQLPPPNTELLGAAKVGVRLG